MIMPPPCGNPIAVSPKRDVSVDAFRCLLMFLIVLHHAACNGYWNNDDTTTWTLPLMFTLLIQWHVDGFLAVSGWFGVRFTLTRFFGLFGIILFWSVVRSVVVFLVPSLSPCKFAVVSGWFGMTYLVFMFIAPLLNAAMDALAKADRKRMWLVWAVFNAGVVANWFPGVGIGAMGGGQFSILTFITVYVNVRFVRLANLDRYFWQKTFFACLALFLLGAALFSLPGVIRHAICNGGAVPQIAWVGHTTYHSPHCMVMAVAVLLLFAKFVRINGWLAHVVGTVAPLMFGVYVIHSGMDIGWNLLFLPEAWMVEHSALKPVAIVFADAVLVFVLCSILEYIRRMVVAPFAKLVIPRIRKIDDMLGLSSL